MIDLSITLLLWIYFICSYVGFFSLWHLAAFWFSKDREAAFQRVNHYYYRSFLFMVRNIVPGLQVRMDKAVRDIRSSVIVCNHLSYLDPVLLTALFNRQKTIVKPVFFEVPIFGWVLKKAGYLPAGATGKAADLLVARMDELEAFLASGGNLFIFPEGTRSRNGHLGPFNDGAFKIARRCKATIQVVSICNTHRLFPPGRFLFNTCISNTIELRHLGCIVPDGEGGRFSVSRMKQRAWNLLDKNTSTY